LAGRLEGRIALTIADSGDPTAHALRCGWRGARPPIVFCSLRQRRSPRRHTRPRAPARIRSQSPFAFAMGLPPSHGRRRIRPSKHCGAKHVSGTALASRARLARRGPVCRLGRSWPPRTDRRRQVQARTPWREPSTPPLDRSTAREAPDASGLSHRRHQCQRLVRRPRRCRASRRDKKPKTDA
jgi:hypothetical protein